jgi:Gluconate 2-dehydrogenase subunit 3
MSLNRRNAIRQLVLVSAGAALLPSCLQDRTKAPIALKNFSVSGEQEELLEELTTTLIPSGATPGAREVSAHLFVLKMLDDCSSKDDRDRFLRGLQQLDKAARTETGTSFTKASAAQRAALLSSLESKKLPDPDAEFCYSTIKRLTIQAYTSSQYYLTRIQVYELVPGRWHGCVPVKNTTGAAS